MATTSEKQRTIELRKRLSIELCENFTKRLKVEQAKQIKIGAIIAIRNFIKESKIDDPILLSFLVDTIIDPDKEVRDLVIKVIEEVINPEIIELLEIKSKEISGKIKEEISGLLKSLKRK